jgi:hypothetical protein
MSIAELNEKIKPYWRIIAIVLMSLIILGLWQLHTQSKNHKPLQILDISQNIPEQGTSTIVYGSKTGTKYYFPWCGALNRIKPENRVQFASSFVAREHGYTPAGNCKGVE